VPVACFVPLHVGPPPRRTPVELEPEKNAYAHNVKLVRQDEKDVVDVDRSPRISECPNPFRFLMFPEEHRRAADTRFFRKRKLFPTADARSVPLASAPSELVVLYGALGGNTVGGVIASGLVAEQVYLGLARCVPRGWLRPGCCVGSHPSVGQNICLFEWGGFRLFDALNTSRLKDRPDGEAAFAGSTATLVADSTSGARMDNGQ